jgi:hypothetical protein
MKLFFIKWMIFWGYLIQGIIGIITLGYCYPAIALNISRKLLYFTSKEEIDV